MVEARGIEPLSGGTSIRASTSLSLILNLAGFTPEGRIKARPAL
ncbi:Cysteine synthase B (fragment) [Tepidanaerobacter acetatoxydans Re1]|uniref:Cysteine synthase B n=1 Tax=Tepidanaerobacter acetatoxydans (strain DSM 21804 / JCM 16047 / Re1) TaxID=1209989 RepID=U4Q817_TEPAE